MSDTNYCQEVNHRFASIGEMPTSFKDREGTSCHESCLRAWNILHLVREYLVKGVPCEVILEIIDFIERPQPDTDSSNWTSTSEEK